VLLWGSAALAQTQAPPSPQFDVLGFIQAATLDTTHSICTPTDPALAGGTVTVNGITMIVPCNTILQMPAATLTWAQLFDSASSAPVGSVIGTVPAAGSGQTRLALTDGPAPFPSFEVHVQGNVVTDPAGGAARYIVGLIVPVTQQGLNASSGIVNYIDYPTGAFRVGGKLNDANCSATAPGGGPGCSGALVQINDPVGRWGATHSPDPRFSADTTNSTVVAATGIPVCIPRVAPPGNDPLCPLFGGSQNTGNRPRNGDPRFPVDAFLATGAPLRGFTMPAPGGDFPDPRQQVPIQVGDQVNYAGTLFKIDPSGPGDKTNTYISAHTLVDNLGIFTAPGTTPAYVYVESFLIGTDGAPVAGLLQEATTRLTVVGTTTDPTRQVGIYAKDVNPCTGAETLRLLVFEDPAIQPVKGRFVHRDLGGNYMPPTREYEVLSLAGTTPNVANGFTAGAFSLPNFEFVFPENHNFGDPLLPFNFQDLPFLAQGSGPLSGSGPVVGQLDPWPGSIVPAKASCASGGTAPIAAAGSDITVAGGTNVTLHGQVTLDPNSTGATISWTQTGGPGDALANPTTLTPSFTAPIVNPGTSAVLTFLLTVTDQFGTGTSTTNVTVTPTTDIVAITAATWKLLAGGKRQGKLSVTATSSDPTASLTLVEFAEDFTNIPLGTGTQTGNPPGTYTWSQSGLQAPSTLTVTSSKGGSATATCGFLDANGIITCQ